MPTPPTANFLLLQVRNPGDEMAPHEIACFAHALDCHIDQITPYDLLRDCPTVKQLETFDAVLLGGSGDYSVAEGGEWMKPALEAMRELHEQSKPTFASCWGFQAMAAALDGTVVTDLSRAEVGTRPISLTDAGMQDDVFKHLPATFNAQVGHEDIVDTLPSGAIHLARSDRTEHQAYTFPGKPIYATQFHPELTNEQLLDRLRTYPKYIQKITGRSYVEFVETCAPSPECNTLLRRFVDVVLD